MIKNFETYINEDYFSKLASRKDNGEVRKENEIEITDDFVRSFVYEYARNRIKSTTTRKENGKTVVDIDGDFYLVDDAKEIPFQFGTVTGDFNCSFCDEITSLEGCPKEVGGKFDCQHCHSLTSLEGCPKEVGGDFYCSHCGRPFTEEEIRKICNVKGKIIL